MAPTLTDEPAHSRFELRDGDELLGWLDYRPAGESVILAHTEVAEKHGHRGLGGTIVRGALEHLAAAGKTVIPTCPFAAAYLHRNPKLAHHVAPSFRAQFAS
jgi:uncharacterized protein